MGNRFEVERKEDSYNLFKKALEEFNIPEDGTQISWDGEDGQEWYDGWGDRPGNYETYTTAGHNEDVTYDKYFEEYLDELDIDIADLNDEEFEEYFLDWADNNIIIGSWSDTITFGELVEEHGGRRDFWYMSKNAPWNVKESKSLKESEDNFLFINEEIENFKKAWIEEKPTSWKDATDRCNDIWEAENSLREVTDYPAGSDDNQTVENWENENTGAYVYGDAYIESCFIYYIFQNKLNIEKMSNEEFAREYFDWADNNCYLQIGGDLWGYEGKLYSNFGDEVAYIPWSEYLDGWTPEWIFEDEDEDEDEDY